MITNQKLQNEKDQITLVDTLRSLRVEDKMIFPVDRLISVRGTISRLKSVLNLKFECRVNDKKDENNEDEVRTFTVTRKK